MTSFYPKTPQSFDDLKAKPPAPLVHLGHADRSVPVELFWLGVKDTRGQALAVGRHDEHGVELTRYINDDPNEILQALADAWGCDVVSEYGNERFSPGGKAVTPLVYKTEHGYWRCADCSMYGGRDGYSATDCNDMLEHLRKHQQLGEKLPEKELHALLWEFWEATRDPAEKKGLSSIFLQDDPPMGATTTYSTQGPHYVWMGTHARRGTGRNCLVPVLPPGEIALESAIASLLATVAADPSTVRMTLEDGWADRVKAHFEKVDLPFGAILKNPAVKATADGVRIVESELLPVGSFYCVTEAGFLGMVIAQRQYRGVILTNTVGVLVVMLP